MITCDRFFEIHPATIALPAHKKTTIDNLLHINGDEVAAEDDVVVVAANDDDAKVDAAVAHNLTTKTT